MADADVTIFICVSCQNEGDKTEKPGRLLLDAVTSRLNVPLDCRVTVKPVDCLAVCKRPCTVALAGPDKWTYVIGDLQAAQADDVVAAALSFGATVNGIIPWRQRPQSFRKGVVSRVPPLCFRPEEQGL